MLKFLGHAGFMYETQNELILMDPWMSTEGAFDSSWYQNPPNHDFGATIRDEILSTSKEVYIYISHEHKDHFDIPYLKTLELSKINFITPKFRRDHVASELSKLSPKSITTPVDSELIKIGNLEIRLFLDDQEIVRDSAIGIYDIDLDYTFLNLNDCKVYDRVDELKNLYDDAGITDGETIYTLCQTAVRATHTWFILTDLLGEKNVKVYDGSWTEWGNDSSLPIETR